VKHSGSMFAKEPQRSRESIMNYLLL